jgi:YHS domain-containing protein
MLDARDPVCGMTVSVPTAYSEAVGGHTYYFCSENCRQRFDANPAAYGADARNAEGTAEQLEQHEPPHTTSRGVTSPKFGSAGSGGAEYERLPEQHTDHADRNPQR